MFKFLSRWLCRTQRHETAPPDSSADDFAMGGELDREDAPQILYAAPVESPLSPEDEINPSYDFCAEGLPPDWPARRQAVLCRDEKQCQVTGCVTNRRSELDVHHIKPRFERPDHRLENLITLCRLHHALLPWNRRAVENFNSDRYTGVSAHWRWNVFRTRRFPVRASIKRFERVSLSNLKEIKETYGLVCECGCAVELRKRIFKEQKAVRIRCLACGAVWMFEQGLQEEIGTQLASILVVTRNKRQFDFDLDHLEVRKPVKVYTCVDCDNNGKVSIMLPRKSVYGKFWGCPNWNGDSSHYTRPWREGDEGHIWR